MKAFYVKTPGYYRFDLDEIWAYIEDEDVIFWECDDEKSIPAFLAKCQECEIDTITRIMRWQDVYDWEKDEVKLEDFQP